MNYNIIYDAVDKKTKTTPPNRIIGNTEMAAGVFMACSELNLTWNNEGIEKPQDIKDRFLELAGSVGNIDENSRASIIIKMIEKYKVKEMVNENILDLMALCQGKMEQVQDFSD